LVLIFDPIAGDRVWEPAEQDDRMAHWQANIAATVAVVLMFLTQQGETLKCYSTNDSVAQQQWTQCDDRKGFRTCFTKYNMKGQVTARGCATKDKVFHIECENHVMGANSEKFCYCSYYLCNGSRASPGGKSGGLLALLFAIIWVLNLIADNIDTKKPLLEKQSVSVVKPSLADQRKPVFENSPSGADLSLEKALAGNEPFREFQGRSL